MIQLQYQPKPDELTPQVEQELTDRFKANPKDDVWKQSYIEKFLRLMSNNKCCYCECNINEESKYMEIEHYRHKHDFKDDVVKWENLFPCCKRCNTTKGKHNVETEPIIHPVNDNPQDHLALKAYRLKGLTDKGEKTKNVLNLNDPIRLVEVRFKIGDKLIEELISLLELVKGYADGQNGTRRRNIITNKLLGLLYQSCPEAEYSAVCATVLLHDENYQAIRQIFVLENLWTAEFQTLEDNVKKCALPEK